MVSVELPSSPTKLVRTGIVMFTCRVCGEREREREREREGGREEGEREREMKKKMK